ncbi:sucrase ferredoxin [Nostoc sp. 'Lobaria pulmonaria (5183) cyanobiont']|uniref:sucrase ferredoxin n=1 Tax=Nostoc sp. 'Lobaria pulmonaria (5183) cyanobiont' TaxID=1618022 RepID=UPI000CF36146|nr:sucrase ferredoxin [Nostoc sp. 'Lobaria pulmonaria (5183) cyanobiont']AVH69227.1 sucraseferredoxin family protein [Nostoc sp. 'Lobaria pulmonaria (5183) cyanobiont']
MEIKQTHKTHLIDCRFCSLVSKANGEDPIGTAGTCDHWLIMETPQPWPEEVFEENPTIQSLIGLFQELVFQHGINLKPILIAPDREYSYAGFTRVLYYYRPARLFSQFEKQEFIVPENKAAALVTAIFKQLMEQPNDLSEFQQYQQQTSHIRELMVCTHTQVDLACGRFGTPIYRQLRKKYAPASNGKLRVWQTTHFGGHQFAPTLIDLPQGLLWGHLEPDVLDLLVQRNASVSGLRQYYRGWTGLSKFEQIAEGEIWIKSGWSWLDYLKAGKVLAIEEVAEGQNANWAEVRIDFAATDGNTTGAYEARIEVCSEVMSAYNSAKEMELEAVKQYHVSRFVKVE